jgi:hypothetical protein
MSKRDQDEGGFEATTGQTRETGNWLLVMAMIGGGILFVVSLAVLARIL